VIEAIPVSDKVARETGYAKVVWYIDAELRTTRAADFFDKQGLKSKRLEVRALEMFGDVPFATDMVMTDLGTGHSSRMRMEELVIDQGVDPTWFTNRTLQSGF